MFSSPVLLLERLSRLVQNDAHVGGLKPTQWEALRFIARANRFSCRPGALTAYLGMTKGTVSQTLQALERKGLIEKKVAEGDRRGVKLALTKAGETLCAKDPLRDLEASLGNMPESQRQALSDSLKALMKDMLIRRGGRAFGGCKTCCHFQHTHDNGAPFFCGLLNEPLSVNDSEMICAEHESD